MNPLRPLMEKPWLGDARPAEAIHAGEAERLDTLKRGLWLFLAVVTVLFLLLTSVYFGRMALPDWAPLQEPWLLWLNGGVLVLTSFAMEWAAIGARREQPKRVKIGLFVGSILTALFLAGQIEAWRQMFGLGYFAAENPSYAFFYVITALHGAHVFGGLVVLGIASEKALRSDDPEDILRTARLCAIYWHFLLAVWTVMFGLLLADNNGAIDFIEMCRGFAAQLIQGGAAGE